MKKFAMLAFAALLAASAISQTPESRPTGDAKDRRMGLAKPVVMTKDREVYGAELTLKENTKLADLVKDPKAYEGRKIRASGTIQDVCQKKGCFMFVKEGDTKVRVQFHQYSFFVPFDVAGRPAAVEGTAIVKEISEAMRRHYAEDQGLPKEEIEKIKGPGKEVVLVVEAVEITNAAKTDAKTDTKPAKKEG